MHYLDNAATTPVLPEVKEAMLGFLDADFGNPSSVHAYGRRAKEAGIRAFSGSCSEAYREAAFADLEIEPLPVARALGDSSLMFEVHPTLDTRRLRDRADAIADIARRVLG